MFQNSKENEGPDSKYSVIERAVKSQLDKTELEYRKLRELVEETLHLYKSSVDSHNHTLTHLRRVQKELDEKKEELDGVHQKLHIKGLKERETFLVKNFRNACIDEVRFMNEGETRFGHQIEYGDIPELVKIFEDDPLMVNKIDVMSHVLKLSQATKSKLALTTFPIIYLKWLAILECWVGQYEKDATYEILIKELRLRDVTTVVGKLEEILQRKRTDWSALIAKTE